MFFNRVNVRCQFGYIVALIFLCLANSTAIADIFQLMDAAASSSVVTADPADTSKIVLEIEKKNGIYTSTVKNISDSPVSIRRITLFDLKHDFPVDTDFYGEGYTMLSQTNGTLAKFNDVGALTDRNHYKLKEPAGFRTVYGMCSFTPPSANTTVFAFTTCDRFIGSFNVNTERIQIVVNTEGLTLHPGKKWKLEDLIVISGPDKNSLLSNLTVRLNENHPRLPWPKLPTGWCSWYCFGPSVTASQINSNLSAFKDNLPQVRFIQIDDGYQPWMGDWLETKKNFKGDIKSVLKQIKDAGFEPAIWVAPFVASPQSKLFKEHPDWFVMDDNGKPLRSDKVTFGGWRLGPWYMLDGTHPETQKYLENVFRTMKKQWGCTYFKLDANVWGAMPFGNRYDKNASSIQALFAVI